MNLYSLVCGLWMTLLGAPALAATVALPEGEAPAAWRAPLSLAGLRLAGPGEAADLVVSAEAGRWILRSASAQPTAVSPPVTPDQREDLALLLASLVRPAERLDWGLVGPARPPPPPPPPRAAPRMVVAKKKTVTPVRPTIHAEVAGVVAAAETPPSLSVLDPLPVAPVPVALAIMDRKNTGVTGETSISVSPWVEVGALGLRRLDLSASYGLGLGAGLARGPLRLGLRWQHPGEADLVALGEDRRVTTETGQAGLWLSPVEVAALGAGGALSRRAYSQDDEAVDHELIPALWLEGRLEPTLGADLRLTVGLSAARDLRATELWVGETRQAELSAWSLIGELGLMWAPGDQDRALRPRKG